MNENTKDQQPWPTHSDSNDAKDHFKQESGFAFAGRHLLIDCWNASNLDNLDHIEHALRQAVDATGATLLHIHLHHFTPNGGVSGVAVLAESHISIHTWPERGYAALDVFMCGDTKPESAVPVFKRAFRTDHIDISEHMRGRQFTDLSPPSPNDKDLQVEI